MLTVKTQLTSKYALYMGQIITSPAEVPWAHESPGTWIWWLLDEDNKRLPSRTYTVGFGPYEEEFKRIAYDGAATFLAHHDPEEQILPLNKVRWDPSPR